MGSFLIIVMSKSGTPTMTMLYQNIDESIIAYGLYFGCLINNSNTKLNEKCIPFMIIILYKTFILETDEYA